MCDYSLEMYKSRSAVEGEDLTIRRFPSGSLGFVESADPDCAVCCKSGVEMILHLEETFKMGTPESPYIENGATEIFTGSTPVTFHTINGGYSYKDGFITPSGGFLLLQRIPIGTCATVTKALPKELTEAVGSKKAFEPEIRVASIVPSPAFDHVEI